MHYVLLPRIGWHVRVHINNNTTNDEHLNELNKQTN